jgi:hypothetical protein
MYVCMMYVCMYVCMYTYTYTYIYIYIYIYVHTYIHIHMRVCVCAYWGKEKARREKEPLSYLCMSPEATSV